MTKRVEAGLPRQDAASLPHCLGTHWAAETGEGVQPLAGLTSVRQNCTFFACAVPKGCPRGAIKPAATLLCSRQQCTSLTTHLINVEEVESAVWCRCLAQFVSNKTLGFKRTAIAEAETFEPSALGGAGRHAWQERRRLHRTRRPRLRALPSFDCRRRTCGQQRK